MKIRKSKIVIILLSIWMFSFPVSSRLYKVQADEWFDSYNSKISWKFERAYLHGFAAYLQSHPDYIGYIVFYTGKKDKVDKIKSQIRRAKNFLISKENIDAKRIIIIDAGLRYDTTEIILQPILKSQEPPKFWNR